MVAAVGMDVGLAGAVVEPAVQGNGLLIAALALP
jgi:hypothetical protein